VKSVIIIAIAFALFLLAPSFIGTSQAQTDDEDTLFVPDDPIIYNVGVDLISVGVIDRESGQSDLIFWLTIVSDDIDFTENPPPDDWDLTNGYVIDMTGTNIEPHFYKTKIRGAFFSDVDFQNYPYDEINLAIHIEPYFPLVTNQVVFKVNEDYSLVNPDTVSVPGWSMGEPTFSSYTTTYPWGDFTHFEANFPIETSPVNVFIKKLLPPIILAFFAFGTFIMSSNTLQNRIAVVVTCLIGSLFFHAIFLLGELPPISYLTLADKMMIAIYTVFVGAGATILMHQRNIDKCEFASCGYPLKNQIRLDKKMLAITVSAMLVVSVVLLSL
jgi:hypothetical protein